MYRMVIVFVMVGLCVNTAAALPGSGTQQNPWRIESLADFDEFANNPAYWDDYTRLETDVNLAGRTYSTAVIAPDTSAVDGFQGNDFDGVFDGNGHKITNLTIDDGGAGNDYLGLFGSIDHGEARNLRLEDVSISGTGSCVGGLVGEIDDGSISNCCSTGSVRSTGGNVGGLVGENYEGSVSNCYSTGSVSGYHQIGGLVGENYHGSISNCYSAGDVSSDAAAGGLVGINCYEGRVFRTAILRPL